ncbi:unnamed protein product [Cuscuta campestris]|uniref:Retrotransposon gag domain-containing protein n=1 Tax=Cuscuta campestris TaxID=132261 RepID=A0A484LTT1_9ASTE|nr:unnamed protein product [Cuscuta campestris]
MSQETAHGQGNNEHVSVPTEASSFTPPIQNEPINQEDVPQNNANAGGQPDYAIPVFLANLLQQVANAPMFQPPPLPPPRVITFKFLKDNGAEEFLGNQIAKPQVAWNWIEQTARVLRDLNVSLNDYRRFAAQLLRGEAYEWWKRTDESNETPKPWTWEFFDWAFKKEYIPARFREEKRTEFVELRQGDMTLPEYRQKFVSLAKFSPTLVSTTTDRIEEFRKKVLTQVNADPQILSRVGKDHFKDPVAHTTLRRGNLYKPNQWRLATSQGDGKIQCVICVGDTILGNVDLLKDYVWVVENLDISERTVPQILESHFHLPLLPVRRHQHVPHLVNARLQDLILLKIKTNNKDERLPVRMP